MSVYVTAAQLRRIVIPPAATTDQELTDVCEAASRHIDALCDRTDGGWETAPAPVVQATALDAARIWARLHSAPLGVISGEMGSVFVGASDSDVLNLIAPYRRIVVA